jgi:uncharacterized surface protein with fasciclin (FAS1) repeats
MLRKLSVRSLCCARLSIAIPALAQNPTVVPAQPAATPTAASAQQANTTGQPATYVRFANLAPGTSITFSAANNQMTASKALDYKAFTDWAITKPGKYTVTATSSGASAAKSEDTELDFKDGGWFTVTAFADASNGLGIKSIDQSFDKILPGTSSMTLVNAIQGDTNIDFIRDDTTYTADLFPLGNSQSGTSWFNILDDANIYHFKVVQHGTADKVLVDAPNTVIRENELYLIAAVGNPSQQGGVEMLISNTDMSQIDLLEGKMQQPGTVIQAAAAHPELAAWLDAVQKAGLSDMLSGKGPFTVFANANFDMSKLPDSLRNDPKALADFLKSQIVAGDLRSKDIFKAGTLNTLTGQTLNLTQQDNKAYVNKIQVIDINIPATNGVIHVVNDFVTPPPQ